MSIVAVNRTLNRPANLLVSSEDGGVVIRCIYPVPHSDTSRVGAEIVLTRAAALGLASHLLKLVE